MRHKKRQAHTYTPASRNTNDPASFEPRKGHKVERLANRTLDENQIYMDALHNQFRIRLNSLVKSCGKKKHDELKSKLLKASRIPIGVVSKAQQNLDVKGSPIESMLRENARNGGPKAVTYWIDYVEQNFDATSESLSKGKSAEDNIG
ncbi:hypothetical protein [Parasitella parasitica]|uniref:Uncharacterized protein n=1 Tax=Parasitella parasitica TaxID=35722 RepID=A0A0B7NMA4_9FUNG|nr:hypothetical protein [Parasitella parasitica]